MIVEDESVIQAAPLDSEALDALKITRLELDSRKVRPGDTFVAIPGAQRDGRDFIGAAIAAGAASVLWESDGYTWKHARRLPNLGVRNLRDHLGPIASRVLGNPSSKLEVISVTGTNGKTSCTQWIASSLSQLGKKCAVVGTLGAGFPGNLSATDNTTPDAASLQASIADFVRQGAYALAMEVSSHALAQARVNAVEFDIAVFTNLTHDHLDYHRTLADYGAAKERLFESPTLKAAVLNVDDAFGQTLSQRLSRPGLEVVGYSFRSAKAAVRGSDLTHDASGIGFRVASPWGAAQIASPIPGRFNAYNVLAVLTALCLSGVELRSAAEVLRTLTPVPGRMQKLGGGELPVVIVDYAHTPDALQNALATLREITKGALVCVFGCGGDRDPGKRPLMGEIATRLADRVVVTSDNPRSEDPLAIIAEIVAGTSAAVQIIPERKSAIEAAVVAAAKDDVVLIAGKGHETYQESHGVKLPFDDAEVANNALKLWSDRLAASQ